MVLVYKRSRSIPYVHMHCAHTDHCWDTDPGAPIIADFDDTKLYLLYGCIRLLVYRPVSARKI